MVLTGVASGDLRATIDNVVHADGIIVVTPIFNASYSGLFKSFFDVLEADSLAGKPVLIAATRRHVAALAGARTCRPADVRLPAVRRRTHVGLRRSRGLGLETAAMIARWPRGSTARPLSWPR
ncbi:MAG: NAD(P)H-dependent oxidoreductase [Nocardioidaceae bacterium]